MSTPSDNVTLIVAGTAYQGWETIQVQRSVERSPSSFTLSCTSAYPDSFTHVTAQAFQSCVLKLGGDTVITGWIDVVTTGIADKEHFIRIVGRGKCCDIVDCAAITSNQQIIEPNLTKLATDLCQPFGITVRALSGDGPSLQQFNVSLGETVWEILARVAQYSAMLIYEGTDGNLVTSAVGKTKHASGISQGVNIERGEVSYDGSQRFSEYRAAYMSQDSLSEMSGGNLIGVVKDASVPRYRPHVVISPATVNAMPLALTLAQWEMARRRGRSQAAILTVDNWRDRDGALWGINNLIDLVLPAWQLPSVTWVIVEVDYTKDESGTHARLVCMPKEALTVSPSSLFAFDADIARALANDDPPKDYNTPLLGPS